ncbi:hypothetical protein QFZ39_003038 [Paraburkholderia graminis]|nr:hypothetical protein [Paraburkholderia graminis]
MRVARLGFRLIDIREDLLAALQIALARLGERDAARGAVQQARAQMRFQIGDRARRVRGRRIKVLRGTRETARLDDADKYAHVLKRIHT